MIMMQYIHFSEAEHDLYTPQWYLENVFMSNITARDRDVMFAWQTKPILLNNRNLFED